MRDRISGADRPASGRRRRLIAAALTCLLALCVSAPAHGSAVHHRAAHSGTAIGSGIDHQVSTLRGLDVVAAPARMIAAPAIAHSTAAAHAESFVSRTADAAPARGPPGPAA